MAKNPEQRKRSVVGRVLAVFGKVIGTIFLVGLLTSLIFACLFVKYIKEDILPQADLTLEGFNLNQTSTIYYTDPETGEAVELLQLYGAENRTWVSLSEIPPELRFACIAIEDKRFEEHQGVDWLRTLKASANMFLGSEDTYGASTLTQQLIKNITGEKEVTVRRKLNEIVQALEFEKKYTKDIIMEWYLNTIYLGEGCYGVQSAARVYFGKDVSELSLAECASLIGITNNPSIYDPYINAEKNKERQRNILWAMYEQGYIETEEEYRAAVDEELVFVNRSGDDDGTNGDEEYYSYFIDQVIRDVTKDLGEKYGYSERIAEQMVRSGGYSIYCTLNPEIQEQVDAVYENLENIPKTDSEQQLQSGIVIIDNETGDVVAMSGGVGEKEGSLTFNRATQALLSPGSTIKPLTVYGPALDRGIITPATVYDDTPYRFDDNNNRWPKNTTNSYSGLMTVNMAVSLSVNTVAVKVLADLTPEYSFDFAVNKLGMDTLVEKEIINGQEYSDVDLAPLALGGLTRGVTIEDMAAAYATYANQGQYREPRTYTKVLDSDGKTVVLDNTQDTVTAVSEKAAWYMTYMLQNAVQSGTGSPAQIENMTVAGKTGTTDNDQDRWFCGYTPYYTAAVWCGYDVPEEVNLTESSTNPAAYLWQKVMAGVHEGLENKDFERPTDVVECYYCQDSGLLATEACRSDLRGSREVKGLLALEDVPTTYCTAHTMVELCDESEQVANEYCEEVEGNSTHEVGLLAIQRMFPVSGIAVKDQAYVLMDDQESSSGYYPAVSSNGKYYGMTCTVHTEESVKPDEEDPNGIGALDPDQPDAQEPGTVDPNDPNTSPNPNDPSMGVTEPVEPSQPSDEEPQGPDWEDPSQHGVPDD